MSQRGRTSPLEIYRLLPRTNCKLCGLASCYMFAFALITMKKTVSDCPELQKEAFRSSFTELKETIGGGRLVEGTDFIIDEEKCTGSGDCVAVCTKALTTLSVVGSISHREEVPPVLQIVDGCVQVVHWSSCKRNIQEATMCNVCVDKCPFGAIRLLRHDEEQEEDLNGDSEGD